MGKRIQQQLAENHCSGITINPRDLVRRNRKRHGIVIVLCPDVLALMCVFKHYFIYYYTFFSPVSKKKKKKYVDKPYITQKLITSLHRIVVIYAFSRVPSRPPIAYNIIISAFETSLYRYYNIIIL